MKPITKEVSINNEAYKNVKKKTKQSSARGYEIYDPIFFFFIVIQV